MSSLRSPKDVGELRAAMETGRSATAQLEEWSNSEVRVEVASRVERAATADEAGLLHLASGSPVQERSVLLHDGVSVLSHAVAVVAMSALTPDAQTALNHTTLPLGRILRPLSIHRDRQRIWENPIDEFVLNVFARLIAGGLPVALVTEQYTAHVLMFGQG